VEVAFRGSLQRFLTHHLLIHLLALGLLYLFLLIFSLQIPDILVRDEVLAGTFNDLGGDVPVSEEGDIRL